MEGQPCYALQEAGKTLKERFPAKMKEARVELPTGALAPGGYNFTLCVSKVRSTVELSQLESSTDSSLIF